MKNWQTDDKEFKEKVRKFDRAFIGILVNIYVSAFTTLAVLTVLGLI